MRVIACLSQKGGTGKTTLALHLAVAADRRGLAAFVADLDPQASSAGWKDSRPGERPAVIAIPHTRLNAALGVARSSAADLCLIDTAPHLEAAAMAAARAADLVLIPCRPGILDLRAIGSTAELCRLAGKPAFVVLNAVPPRASQILSDAKAAVAIHDLEVAPITMHQRAAYSHSLTVGQTAQEYDPHGNAAGEMESLLDWLAALPAIQQSAAA
jgi:chromosome partitioning protein